jgi:hypothetical protein
MVSLGITATALGNRNSSYPKHCRTKSPDALNTRMRLLPVSATMTWLVRGFTATPRGCKSSPWPWPFRPKLPVMLPYLLCGDGRGLRRKLGERCSPHTTRHRKMTLAECSYMPPIPHDNNAMIISVYNEKITYAVNRRAF